MSEAAWERQRKVYAMLERAGPVGLAVCDMPTMATTLDKVWGRSPPRVFRYWDMARHSYVYVLEKFDDRRYSSWINGDGDLGLEDRMNPPESPSSSGSPTSSTLPASSDGSESTSLQ